MRDAALVAFLMGLAGEAWAQQQDPLPPSPWVETRFHRVHLRNGNAVDGQLVRASAKAVTLQLKAGEIAIRRDLIDHVEMVKMRSLREPAPPAPKPEPPAGEKHAEPAKDEEKTGSAPPAALATSLPEVERRRLEKALTAWIHAPVAFRGDLLPRLEPLSGENVRYLAALLQEKPRRFPIDPICDVLAQKRDPSTVPVLGGFLDGAPMKERETAIQALRTMGLPECAPYLFKALDDPASSVWRPASEALVALNRESPQSRVVDTLLSRVEQAREKAPYAMTLGAIGSSDAYRGLLYLSRSHDDDTRLAALQGLMPLLRVEEADHVVAALYSPVPAIRKQACSLLGKVKYRPMARSLIDMIEDRDVGVAIDAHRALQEITGQAMARDRRLWQDWWDRAGSKE